MVDGQAVDPRGGREYEDAQQNIARVEIGFVTRYTTGITSKNRVVFNNENYQVESVVNLDQRNREMENTLLQGGNSMSSVRLKEI